MTELLTPAITMGLTGVLIAAFLYAKDWFTNRSLKTTLENLTLKAEIAARELLAAKETDKVQAAKVEKIEELSVQTHQAVNSQRDKLEAKLEKQQLDFEAKLTALRAEIKTDAALQLERTANAARELQAEKEKLAQATLQAVKDQADAAAKLLEAQRAPALPLPSGEVLPTPLPLPAPPPLPPAAAEPGPPQER